MYFPQLIYNFLPQRYWIKNLRKNVQNLAAALFRNEKSNTSFAKFITVYPRSNCCKLVNSGNSSFVFAIYSHNSREFIIENYPKYLSNFGYSAY